MGSEKPVVTVVTVHGIVAPGVTIETDPGGPTLPVQIRPPSKPTPKAWSPSVLATVVTTPAGCDGSIWKSLDGAPYPTTKILPIATTSCSGLAAPVHVSRSLPSLARTREMFPEEVLDTQTSVPSDRT